MPEEIVRLMCPNLVCKRVLAVPGSARGKTVRCRFCSTSIRIPKDSPANAAPAPPPEQKAPAKTPS